MKNSFAFSRRKILERFVTRLSRMKQRIVERIIMLHCVQGKIEIIHCASRTDSTRWAFHSKTLKEENRSIGFQQNCDVFEQRYDEFFQFGSYPKNSSNTLAARRRFTFSIYLIFQQIIYIQRWFINLERGPSFKTTDGILIKS